MALIKELVLPIDKIVKLGLTINEYVVLYDVSTGYQLSGLIDNATSTLINLEEKGFIRFKDSKIFLRGNSSELFTLDEKGLFEQWLEAYPTSVKTKNGGSRALSFSDPNGKGAKQLRSKWNTIFKNNREKQEKALAVTKLYIANLKKSGDLGYAVQAMRFLNGAYYEQYEYLLKEQNELDNIGGVNYDYSSEDFI